MEIKPGDTKRGAYSKKTFQLLTVSVSPYCELIRWVLERASIPYQEACSAPVLHLLANKWHGGTSELPVLISSEASLLNALQSLNYIDARLPADLRLYPRDVDAQTETERLLSLFLDKLGSAVRSYSYAYLLPEKALLLPIITEKVPVWQSVIVAYGYPIIRAIMQKALPAGPEIIESSRQQIQQIFDEMNALLTDGRSYLLGEQFSVVDISFAAMAAPLLAPTQYGSPLPAFASLPKDMQKFSASLRDTLAGKLVLKLYENHRPVPQLPLSSHPASTTPENHFNYYKNRLIANLTGGELQKWAFALLRQYKPVLVFGKTAIITRDKDVREALARDSEFTIAEINAPNMLRLNGPFFLGMDRSPQYDHEKSAMRKVIKADESRLIRQIVHSHCEDLINAALAVGRIDMVSQLARPAAARFIDSYFGVKGPNEVVMMRWMRSLFHDLFINLSNDRGIQQTAEQSYHELSPYLLSLIAERKQQIRRGMLGDDFLSRLIQLQLNAEIALDDDAVRRNISGLIVGALDTTSMLSTLIMQQLLNKPGLLEQARQLVDDEQQFLHFCFDVLRFNTMAAAMRRHCRQDTLIAGTTIPAGTQVFIATASAMLDERAWPDPLTVRTDRALDSYLHFGDGMHRCFGEYINRIQVPIIVASLVRLPKLRKISCLLYDGPFPDQFVLAFDKPDINS